MESAAEGAISLTVVVAVERFREAVDAVGAVPLEEKQREDEVAGIEVGVVNQKLYSIRVSERPCDRSVCVCVCVCVLSLGPPGGKSQSGLD